MTYNKRETRHIVRAWENHRFGGQMFRTTRKKSVKTSRNKTKINNHLDMDNNERFKNVCIGFSIQCGRIMNFINQENNQQLDLVNQGLVILKRIQNSLLELQKLDKKYKNHLNNNFWCMTVMKPYAKTLEQVIADVDVLVKGGVVDHGKIRKI